jgi:hypothetical protein
MTEDIGWEGCTGQDVTRKSGHLQRQPIRWDRGNDLRVESMAKQLVGQAELTFIAICR